MEIRSSETNNVVMTKYAELLGRVFPKSRSLSDVNYLKWLYSENPAGRVKGCDAWDGDVLAAHYVCIPVTATLDGQSSKGLLSLNTVTDPKYQGHGLFTKLAHATFEQAGYDNFDFVYGVANANSTHGFTKKLGFQLVAPLIARIGYGNPIAHGNNQAKDTAVAFKRNWDQDILRWRMSNPCNPCAIRVERQALVISAATSYPFIKVRASIADVGSNLNQQTELQNSFALSLYLGLITDSEKLSPFYCAIPEALKPSPLNLIFKSLGNATKTISPTNTSISFLDFDAY